MYEMLIVLFYHCSITAGITAAVTFTASSATASTTSVVLLFQGAHLETFKHMQVHGVSQRRLYWCWHGNHSVSSSSSGGPACSRSTWHPGIPYWDISRHLPAVAPVESNGTSTPQPGPGTDQHSVWGLPQVCVCRPGKTCLAQRAVYSAQVRRTRRVFVDMQFLFIVSVLVLSSDELLWFIHLQQRGCLPISQQGDSNSKVLLNVGPVNKCKLDMDIDKYLD